MELMQDIKDGHDFSKTSSDSFERSRKLLKYHSKTLFNGYHSLKSQMAYTAHPFLSLYQFIIDFMRLFYNVFLFACSTLMFKLENMNERFIDFLINLGATGMEFAAIGFSLISLVVRSLVSLFTLNYFEGKENDVALVFKNWKLNVTHEKALSESFFKRQVAAIEKIGSDFSQELKHHTRAFATV